MKKSSNDSAAIDAEATISAARAALNGEAATLDELTQAHGAVAKVATDSEAESAELADRRPNLLLNGSDNELGALDLAAAQAGRRRERAEALATELAERIRAVEAEIDEDRRRSEYQALLADIPLEMARVKDDYVKGAKLITDALRREAQLTRRADAINKTLPPGCAPLPAPNAWRATAGAPRAERAQETVELWTHYGAILPPPAVERLTNIEGKTAWLPATIGERTGGRRVVLRSFLKTTVRRPRFVIPTPLASSINLPAFDPRGRPVWEPIEPAFPDAVLSAIERLRVEAATPKAPMIVEEVSYTAIEQADNSAKAA